MSKTAGKQEPTFQRHSFTFVVAAEQSLYLIQTASNDTHNFTNLGLDARGWERREQRGWKAVKALAVMCSCWEGGPLGCWVELPYMVWSYYYTYSPTARYEGSWYLGNLITKTEKERTVWSPHARRLGGRGGTSCLSMVHTTKRG